MSESYEKLTVIELRHLAREKDVKLGAGISKQGIIDKLTEAGKANTPAADSQDALPEDKARTIRSAAIITDETVEDDEDDVPVLTPNPALKSTRAPAPRPAAQPAPVSSLSSISSKAPAFTMEGSRAWHNPKAYQPNAAYQQRMQPQQSGWGAARQQPVGMGEPRVYGGRQDQLGRAPMAPRPAPTYPQRFGPEQGSEDYRAPYPQQDYAAPRGDYQQRGGNYPQRGDYLQPRSTPAYGAQQSGYSPKGMPQQQASMPEMLAVGECADVSGVLETHPDGYGFLRTRNYQPAKDDVYVSLAQVRRFGLRTGDFITGKAKPQRESDRSGALLYVTEINGRAAEENLQRPAFDTLTAIYPKKQLRLSGKKSNDPALRLIDLFAPIGLGQRALICAAPQSGKTTILRKLAAAIAQSAPKATLITLLLDERPEEITEMQETVEGEVHFASFDEPTENQIHVSDVVLERAMRLVEEKQDVVLLVDSLTKLARACNTVAPQTARTGASGLAAGALNKAKRLFGAARNVRQGGSLTVLAFVAAENDSKLDEAVLNEMRSAATMELTLDRQMAEKKLFPALQLQKSATRHAELLLSAQELSAAETLRERMSTEGYAAVYDQLLAQIAATDSNADMLKALFPASDALQTGDSNQ